MSTIKVTTVRNEQDSTAVSVNRTVSDGNILNVSKDGTIIGSLGSASSDVYLDSSSGSIQLRYGGTEAARIDSSGNLLVNTTNVSPANGNVVGIAIKSNGLIQASSDSNNQLTVNRKTNDGNMIIFKKDGTTVGSIGSATGGTTYIDGGSTYAGIQFGGNGSTEGRIVPRQNGAIADNKTDLGTSSYRFKDLYLSGGVYVGGTGSANYLDDYEEGTWTPGITATGLSVTIAEGTGKYTKIGNLVQWEVYIETSAFSGGSGNLTFTGLPFTVESGRGCIGVAEGGRINTGLVGGYSLPLQNTSNYTVRVRDSVGTSSSDNLDHLQASAWSNLNPTVFFASGSYRTTS